MSQVATVTFYSVEQCGLFKWGAKTPEVGDLTVLLDDLYKWGHGKGLAKTVTYQVSDGQNLLPGYLFNISKSHGRFLLTIWNQTPSFNGRVASVDPNSSVGSVSVSGSRLRKGDLPGYPTYFWFIPSQNVVACIQFGRVVSGVDVLEAYFRNFIDPLSNYVVFSSDKQVVRYKGTNETGLRSRFKLGVCRTSVNKKHVLSRYADVVQVIRKTNLTMSNYTEKQTMEKLVGMLRRTKASTFNVLQPNNTVNIRYQMPAEFAFQDLSALIEDWETTNKHSKSEWDDYGFKIKGEANKTYWLSGDIVRGKVDFDVSITNGVVNQVELQKELDRKSRSIIGLLS
ncbi:MAG: hypothetical protein VX796_14565 [Pseudomonadota bacterium]|nr:hypothetical protein [Pseudomonadota bacterium]